MVRSIVAIIVGYLIYASILTGSVMSLFPDARDMAKRGGRATPDPFRLASWKSGSKLWS